MNNTEYSITYRRKLSESYQVITFEKGKLKIHELEMLRRNQLPGMLPVEFMLADGKGQFWYNITGLQSLEDLRKTGHFREDTLKKLVEGLAGFLKTAEQYMLREESIRLDEIFFSPDGGRVYFGYLPFETGEESSAKERFMQLLDGLIKTADYRDNDYVTYLFSLYEALGRENAGIGTLLDIAVKPERSLSEENGIAEQRTLMEERDMTAQKTFSEERSMAVQEKFPEGKKISDEGFSHRLREFMKNKYLDQVWNVKKKIRRYSKVKPEKWEEITLIQPEEGKEESRNTQFLGEAKEAVGRIRFTDPARESLPLISPKYVVGKRKEYADLVVEDSSVSRVHALIVREEDGYYLEDLNSLNGTFLNGSLLELKERVRLKSQDEIGVGNTTLIFEEG